MGRIELSGADRSGCAGGQTENPALRRGRFGRAAQGQRGGGRSPHTRHHRRSLLSPSRAKVFFPDAPGNFSRSLAPSGTLAAGSASERAPWLRRLQVHPQTRRWGPSEEDLTWGRLRPRSLLSRRVGGGDGETVAVVCVVVLLGTDGRRLLLCEGTVTLLLTGACVFPDSEGKVGSRHQPQSWLTGISGSCQTHS